jgi:hypothetical protein
MAVLAAAVLTAGVGGFLYSGRSPHTSGPLVHEAYVWQRAWTPAVREAVAQADPAVSGLVVLAAEVSWEGRRPRWTEVAVDWAALKSTRGEVGLAVRVGAYEGSLVPETEAGRILAEVCEVQIDKAVAAGVGVKELQIDYDCPASRLDDYRQWIVALKAKVAPTPVVFTALPSWLGRAGFGPLAEAADGFILQVHSLERPASADAPLELCNPAAAQHAVEVAARFGWPFRVALPTYSYLLAFDSGGCFVGLSAEGPAPSWPEGTVVRPLRSDPAAMAGLVRSWQADRPVAMQGIIWYRLPTSDDTMNWRPATFAAVLAGTTPQGRLRAQARRAADRLVEIELVADGQASVPLGGTVVVRWRGGRLIAADAIGGFERTDVGGGTAQSADGCAEIRFAPAPATVLPDLGPGERKAVGWIRLSEDAEVDVEVLQ